MNLVAIHYGLNQELAKEYGTEGRDRTGTSVRKPDFESGASTSSATPACSAHCSGISPLLQKEAYCGKIFLKGFTVTLA